MRPRWRAGVAVTGSLSEYGGREDCRDRGHRRHRARRGPGSPRRGTRRRRGHPLRRRRRARTPAGCRARPRQRPRPRQPGRRPTRAPTPWSTWPRASRSGTARCCPGAWRRHDRLRTDGVANVVEAARRAGVRRVVQESVSFLYADQGDDWITEQQPRRDHPDDRAGRRRGVAGPGLHLRAPAPASSSASARSSATTGRPGTGCVRRATAGRIGHRPPVGLGARHAHRRPRRRGARLPARPERRLQRRRGAGAARTTSSRGTPTRSGSSPGPSSAPFGRWLIGPRLEPLTRSLRVCSRPLRRPDRLAAPSDPSSTPAGSQAALAPCPIDDAAMSEPAPRGASSDAAGWPRSSATCCPDQTGDDADASRGGVGRPATSGCDGRCRRTTARATARPGRGASASRSRISSRSADVGRGAGLLGGEEPLLGHGVGLDDEEVDDRRHDQERDHRGEPRADGEPAWLASR